MKQEKKKWNILYLHFKYISLNRISSMSVSVLVYYYNFTRVEIKK